MNPTLAYIRACALHWMSYKIWVCGSENIRGYEMHKSMKDLVMSAALYRVERRKAMNYQ
jgi:hypothetical protein